MKRFKPIAYKGFLVTITRKNRDLFKYEYEIKSISKRSKFLFIKKKVNMISSPTSYMNKRGALQHCKFNIDQLFKIYIL